MLGHWITPKLFSVSIHYFVIRDVTAHYKLQISDTTHAFVHLLIAIRAINLENRRNEMNFDGIVEDAEREDMVA